MPRVKRGVTARAKHKKVSSFMDYTYFCSR